MPQGEEAFAFAAAERPFTSIFSRLYAWPVTAEQHISCDAEFGLGIQLDYDHEWIFHAR